MRVRQRAEKFQDLNPGRSKKCPIVLLNGHRSFPGGKSAATCC